MMFTELSNKKNVVGFIAINTERLRACAEKLVETILLHRRAQIVLTNCKLVLLDIIQDVFVRAAGKLGLGVLRAKMGAYCHCQFDGIRAAVLMLLSAKMTLPAVLSVIRESISIAIIALFGPL
jgi:hypothetical protein